MDAKLTIADKLGRGLTNSIFFVTRKWKVIMLSYVFIISIGSALLYLHDGSSLFFHVSLSVLLRTLLSHH